MPSVPCRPFCGGRVPLCPGFRKKVAHVPDLCPQRCLELIDGITDGMKGVVGGPVILLLAITIGGVSKEAGGGAYLVDLLSARIPFWALPVMLQVLTIVIAFSTAPKLPIPCISR